MSVVFTTITRVIIVSTILLLKSGEPMPKIGYTEDTFDLVEVEEPSRIQAAKKVGVHKRRVADKTYESPRIILDSHFRDFIGKSFRAYLGRAVCTIGTGFKQEGDCIILFFPDGWNR